MTKITSEDTGVFYHHYPAVTVVVTAHVGGRENAMAAAWHTPISFSPPLYGVALSPKRFTYQLITKSREFGVNFLPSEKAELVAAVGGSKGGEVDKFQAFNILKDSPIRTAVPILKDAYAAYECQLVDDRAYGDHRLLVGQIVAVHWLPEAFTADETLDLDKINPVLYLGRERYLTALKGAIKTLDREIYGKVRGGLE
ncbi:MAG: flavin reductase family protein [Dehalococcoidia bacterium]|nr:MAG: flavin reductase family protein [Dehalococcoidia bacterium]